jgi:hypothetical protein
MFCFFGLIVQFPVWADLPTQRQGEIWAAKRQIILRKVSGEAGGRFQVFNAKAQRSKDTKILTGITWVARV